MASLVTAAGRLWRAISPGNEEADSCGDANPNPAAASSSARASLSTNPSGTPRKEAGARDDELSSESTLPLPYTPPRTMEADPLFRQLVSSLLEKNRFLRFHQMFDKEK